MKDKGNLQTSKNIDKMLISKELSCTNGSE